MADPAAAAPGVGAIRKWTPYILVGVFVAAAATMGPQAALVGAGKLTAGGLELVGEGLHKGGTALHAALA